LTTDPTRMLQLLEPAVRPGTAGQGSGVSKGKTPFESRSFQDLLNDVSRETSDASGKDAPPPQESNLLARLGGLGQVENAALRRVLTQGHPAQQADAPQQSGQGK